jgi:methylmalonyl-CoA mutase cobalamin-binding subunit
VDKVVDAHLAARRLAERIPHLAGIMSTAAAEALAELLLARGSRFRDHVLEGLDAAGFDLTDPAEMLLALRRIGPAELERRFSDPAGAAPVASPFVDEIETLARQVLATITPTQRDALAKRPHRVVVATTDVHFYGKRLLSIVLERLGIWLIDGGVSVDPDVLAEIAAKSDAEAVAVSTYNGVALSFVQRLKGELAIRGCQPRLFIGGRLNEILDDTDSSLPVDVTNELRQSGAMPCRRVEDLIAALATADEAVPSERQAWATSPRVTAR